MLFQASAAKKMRPALF